MYFFIQHVDRPNSLELRKATREAHLAYAAKFNLLVGGATLDDETGSMDGSVIIVDLPDRAALDTFIAEDPYTRAGLFQRTTVKAWKKAIPAG
ncbi:MAG: YciI family protein [Candidatus Hydrogenedentota bacterium]